MVPENLQERLSLALTGTGAHICTSRYTQVCRESRFKNWNKLARPKDEIHNLLLEWRGWLPYTIASRSLMLRVCYKQKIIGLSH